jgi:26S proteasome regulatory subunit N3
MNARLLALGVEKHMQQESMRDIKQVILKVLKEMKGNDMDNDVESIKEKGDTDSLTTPVESEVKRAALPEVDLYMTLLSLMFFLDNEGVAHGLDVSTAVVMYLQTLNRRSMDALAARSYYYYARFYELEHRSDEVRGVLLSAQRTATLRRDEELQATLLNLLLRNLLQARLYDQADKLISKTVFPEHAGTNQFVRYYYYLGRIKAIQLDYAEAYRHLQQAIVKAPQAPATAGFLQTVHKFSILVQLLMGEMPDHSIFRQSFFRRSLRPYFELAQAVRIGDLVKFQTAMARGAQKFRSDETYTLILRLRHNVIKTGLRMINLAYSRISLDDICTKLHLDSREDAEYIIAKVSGG